MGFTAGTWRLAVLTAATALLVTASPAIASTAGGYTYTSGFAVGQDRLEASAGCADGTKLLSVGAGTSAGYGTTALNSAFPADGDDIDRKPDDLATVRGDVFSVADKTVQVLAVCAPGGVSYASESFKTKPHKGRTHSVDCPPGTGATGGGVRASGSFATQFLVGSRPFDDADANDEPDDGWQASVRNDSDKRRKSTAWAICGQGDYTYTLPGGVEGGPGLQAEVQTDCPDGLFAIGGGAEGSAPLGEQRITRTLAFNDVVGVNNEVPDDGWAAAADNLSSEPQTLTVSAICGPDIG